MLLTDVCRRNSDKSNGSLVHLIPLERSQLCRDERASGQRSPTDLAIVFGELIDMEGRIKVLKANTPDSSTKCNPNDTSKMFFW